MKSITTYAKYFFPYVVAPIPLIAVLLGICLWVIISPEDYLIDGRPDNAPDRAAVGLITVIIPFFLYPILIGILFIQTWIMSLLKRVDIIGSLFASLIIAFPLACFFGRRMYAPQLGESLPIAVTIVFFVLFLVFVSTLLIYFLAKKHIANKSAHTNRLPAE